MTTQTEIPGITIGYRIPTQKRTMALSSLRPGDWLRGPSGLRFCVMANSSAKERVLLWSEHAQTEYSTPYMALRNVVVYVGQGKPRLWLTLLPKWVQKRVCLFGGPGK